MHGGRIMAGEAERWQEYPGGSFTFTDVCSGIWLETYQYGPLNKPHWLHVSSFNLHISSGRDLLFMLPILQTGRLSPRKVNDLPRFTIPLIESKGLEKIFPSQDLVSVHMLYENTQGCSVSFERVSPLYSMWLFGFLDRCSRTLVIPSPADVSASHQRPNQEDRNRFIKVQNNSW